MLRLLSGLDWPLVLENCEQHRVADMAGPGDAIGAEHAFAHGTELLHRRLGTLVAAVDPELDPAHAAVEGAAEHHIFNAAVETGATELRTVVGAADLERLPSLVD